MPEGADLMEKRNSSSPRISVVIGKMLPASVSRQNEFEGKDSLVQTVIAFLDDHPEERERLEDEFGEIGDPADFSFRNLRCIVGRIQEILAEASF